MPTAKRPVTIVDIAGEAGVSVATVSRALRDDREASPATKEHVLMVARRMGYVVNTHAQALRHAAPTIVGALLRDSSNPIYGALHVALQRRANEVGMSVIAMTAVDPDLRENEIRAIETLLELRVGGILICSGTFDPEALTPFIGRTPIVSLARPVVHPEIHSIAYDERAAGRAIAEALVDAGHTRVAVHTVTAEESMSGHVRTEALIEALRGLAEVISVPYARDHDEDAGLSACMRAGATALACANDAIMIRYLALAQRRGILVPGALSLVGCDHIGPLAAAALGLTSYRLPVAETANAGVDLMLELLGDPTVGVHRRELQGEFVPGRTLGSPAL